MKSAIHIGTIVDKDGVKAISDAIANILSQRADQKTIRTALGTFASLTKVENISLSDVNVTIGGPVESDEVTGINIASEDK